MTYFLCQSGGFRVQGLGNGFRVEGVGVFYVDSEGVGSVVV